MKLKNKILVYGSYGYTGKLIIDELERLSLPVLLARRNEVKLRQQSLSSGFPYEVIDLAQTEQLENALCQAKVVIHCAGPFVHTAEIMVRAGLKTKTHYTDITGEFRVFENLNAFDHDAQVAGITIMPGMGFDVVPTDCLAVHLKSRLPDATQLELAFTSLRGGFSRGTAYTSIENLGYGSYIRERGKIKNIRAASRTKEIDFGPLKMKATCIPWGDIVSAYQSTGIPDIAVFTGVPEGILRLLKRTNYIAWLLRKKWVQAWLKRRIDARPEGPSADKRKSGKSLLWGKVSNESGNEKITLLETLDGFTLTATAASAIAFKIFNDNFKSGYQTPAMAYGADLILEVPASKRTDV